MSYLCLLLAANNLVNRDPYQVSQGKKKSLLDIGLSKVKKKNVGIMIVEVIYFYV